MASLYVQMRKKKDFKFIFMCIRDGLHDLKFQMNEQNLVLVTDGSDAIRNGFLKIFGMDNSIVMC